ncbi:uncharacterized protein BO97DRAFT_407046 [Aspergillus homomorphus CBS 101889]|uniref:DUF7587 domain-containing protein n=1 Tax=Aspergillus homomorphus (strain CBS 101889) TaxID=1450537 RepID=A0A395HSA1_ASPHC|nr:hypothetical protein BO97DRAFT_407046 [Aspergillus homomorphus CBS 101889]RAL10369.1 hypothetical protein BO97DRAFT_407046 [Aspergillus homomorphus CBS 101889]
MRVPLYRVEDNESRARFRQGRGIRAEGYKKWVHYNPLTRRQRESLKGELWAHLDWRNRSPTPFISTSRDRDWVFDEASRRKQEGKTNVRVYKIKVPDDLERYSRSRNCRVVFKKLTKWLGRAHSTLPCYAPDNCSWNEYLFLHDIPSDLIKDITDEWRREML